MEGNYTTAVYDQNQGTNAVWILCSAGFIFLMQAGFALIEAGAVRTKNRHTMLIKNLFNGVIASIFFWLFGYGFGFGAPSYFVGHDNYYYASWGFESLQDDNYLYWVIQFAYCMVTVSIYQGALAERTQIWASLLFTAMLAGFVYPVILAWTWGHGWLNNKGYHDFAGTGIIHLVGGVAGFWGAWICGERRAKVLAREGTVMRKEVDMKAIEKELSVPNADYSAVARKHFKPHSNELKANNNTLIVLGTIIVLTCYMFFTGGRTYS